MTLKDASHVVSTASLEMYLMETSLELLSPRSWRSYMSQYSGLGEHPA